MWGAKAAKCPRGTEVQSLVFRKSKWAEKRAKQWAFRHGFKYGTIEETTRSYRLRQKDPGEFTRDGFRTIDFGDGIEAVIGCPRRDTNMAETAVINKGKKKHKKKRNPSKAYGAAANPKKKKHHKKRRRNPESSALSPYSGGGYYRRPNKARRNPSALDMDTWTRVLPAGVAGIWVCRWAVNMAGPFEADDKGVPVPGFKHFVAGVLAVEVGGRLVGDLLGAQREVDIAQIAGISYMGDLFMRTRILRDSQWVQQNISLEGAQACTPQGTMGADTFTDAAGNRYVRRGGGWQLADWQYSAAMGQAGTIEIPAGAQTGDIIRTGSGEMYQLLGDGTVGRLQNPSVARTLDTPTADLPGGSHRLGDFYEHTPLGSFHEQSQLGRRVSSRHSSFGYAVHH